MGEITTITKATTTSKSLRTTIPTGVAKQLKLTEGGKLYWEIKAENAKLIVIVTPLSE
jgi:antitoxin component of MazEF toxin-antitoxin module